ncbi:MULTISPECIES: CRISPR-associated helicase Cas3' [Arthrobacter]|uniref:CRISPR-associated helicase Cas3 n=2 Tax=Arthrobacter TaxID=1663 RepID=A0ABU9KK66_9MICC|nr:CRISPR-associated helicase Cas3' [Arthrobacter sp. YJM1]MDP5227049.1 CRISPR-associated helicase Cas3' [Arthrobacter sp. YJM1]
MISAAAQSVWGKSDRDTGEWMSLWRHMQDSAAVAGKLWDEWLSWAVKNRLQSACCSDDESDVRTLVTWLAATHDAGKAHPLFAFQVYGLAEKMRDCGLDIPLEVTPDGRIPHSVLGYSIVSRWLTSECSFPPIVAMSHATVSGGHHGVPPTTVQVKTAREATEALDRSWHEVQNELMTACAEMTGAADYLRQWRGRRLTPEAQMLLTAVVIVADWIASNPDLFPYGDCSPTEQRLARAWTQLDLAQSWSAPDPPSDPDELFASRFDLPPGSRPSSMQRSAFEAAMAMKVPGVLIIEAAMGEGKTEAALTAAEVFAAKWGLGGAIFALPTQATSDAMFTRFPSWVEKLPDKGPCSGRRSIYLAHSKSQLNDDFRRRYREDAIGGAAEGPIAEVYDDGPDGRARRHAAVAHQWLSGRKKGMLADFVVATIDQVLFAALQSRHVVLRHLALAGKVVIIDECHAYDAFMNRYLHQVLSWLAAYGVPVILLSATLPAETRKQLVHAYESGRPNGRSSAEGTALHRRSRRGRKPAEQTDSPLDGDPGYPLIVASSPDGPVMTTPETSGSLLEVTIRPLEESATALLDALEPIRLQGGCAGIICNTVGRAQGIFKELATAFTADELILVHSRFMAPDRMELERRIRELLGRDDVVKAAGMVRPHRLIVVGTQVLEQSLDVDFDLMITDIAPVDLLLQRIGRLHRRRTVSRPRPAHLEEPVCLIRGVKDWVSEPPALEDGSAAVYGKSLLFRTLAVLGTQLASEQPLYLPPDISELVQASYAELVAVPDSWREEFAEAEAEREAEVEQKVNGAELFLLKTVSEFTDGLAIDLLERNTSSADEGAQEASGLARVRDTD